MKEHNNGHNHEQIDLHTGTEKLTMPSFGNYDLVRRIDVGGMGEVYLARQRSAFGREVAVKIIRSDLMHDTTARKRFLREAEVSAYLKHDHILPLIEFSEYQGRLFLVTPYIKGGNLARYLQNGPLPLDEVYRLFSALAEAVAYLHRRGVVHRDLKPSNILLDRAEDSGRIYVRLIDFGIASLQGAQASAPLTMAGHEVGTAAYMAPERLDGIAAPSNDIFSLGIMLYQMITGMLPSEESPERLIEPLATLVRRCTASNPAERFANADELLQDFEQSYQIIKQKKLAQPSAKQAQKTISVAHPPPTNLSSSGKIPVVRKEVSLRAEAVLHQKEQVVQHGQTANHTISRPASTITGKVSRPQIPETDTASRLPATGRPEIILPPLPGKGEKFSGVDYDAPTSYIDDSPPISTGKHRRSLAHSASTTTGTGTRTSGQASQPKRKLPSSGRFPCLTMIIMSSIVVVGLIAATVYVGIQAATTATISITPETQAISEVFELSAKLNAKNDLAALTIAANVQNSTQKGTLDGQTTGTTGCILGILNCKKGVSSRDVLTISEQLRPGVQELVKQDITKKMKDAGAIPIGDIVYTNETLDSSPRPGEAGDTVKVTMSLTGSQAYFKPGDAQNMARQLLQQKVKKDYMLIDTLTQIGKPVVQSIGNDGTVKLKIAAASVARYQIPQDTLENLRNSLKGKTTAEARQWLKQQPEFDPETLSVRVTLGETIPTDTRRINITVLEPVDIPRVQLTPVVPPSQ